jgi:hypothetical protein
MNDVEFESAPAPSRPKTATVLGLLAVAAAVLSYLGAYAMPKALVAAEVLKPWPANQDPRPAWFAVGFVVLIVLFCLIGFLARLSSARHLRQIERMEQESD